MRWMSGQNTDFEKANRVGRYVNNLIQILSSNHLKPLRQRKFLKRICEDVHYLINSQDTGLKLLCIETHLYRVLLEATYKAQIYAIADSREQDARPEET